MRFSLSHILFLAAATSLVDAEGWTKHEVGTTPNSHLLGRQSDDGFCSGSSCAACFGAGNVVCSGNSCFNPSAGEQCCSDGDYCIGPDTSCCGSAGAGVTGSPEDDTPSSTSSPSDFASLTSLLPSASSTSSSSGGDEWDCQASDSGEECCQRGGSESHWCYGFYPTNYCYRPSLGEVCCSDGSICDGSSGGADCCSSFGAVATTPNPADSAPSTTASGGAAATGLVSSGAADATSSFDFSGGLTSSSTRTRTTSTGSASASSSGPAQVTAVSGAGSRAEGVFAALGVVGAGLALL
ncbi:hypothetical protein B0J12DRAFT_439882 [Macrophomina phaseolina]|uniref:GPI anchored protein n=1 Tax=Macrophomina phaseolina TaxID=35725 RepID=A0ABQ8GHQ2_9PEZI|nr:hypothetical protein B0J12DRAFT_439882 [Macrophomina phaseolina]